MDEEFNVEQARDCLLEEIVGCFNCQPWEGGPFWLGPNSDLVDLLVDCEIEEGHWEEVLAGLNCPSCGTELTSPYDEVEIKSEYDRKVEGTLRQAQSPELIEQLRRFHEFLASYPYLGLCDPSGMGQKIREAIRNWPVCQLESTIWYRARKLNEQSRIYTIEEMCAPDPNKVYIREGRYNHTGQSFLYLSGNPEAAFHEIRLADENLCAMQKFQTKEAVKVLDLRSDLQNLDPEADLLAIAIIYNGYLQLQPQIITSWKPEYFIPRFIADCARFAGYEGIRFSSATHFGENLVVFPQKISAFAPEGECEVFVWKEQRLSMF